MSFTSQIKRALKKLRYPDIDANGNLIGSVSPRRNTLANLLVVADGGDGEMAQATDKDAAVIYKADGTADYVAYANRKIQAQSKLYGTATIAAGASLNLPLTSGVFDSNDIINADDTVAFPAQFANHSAAELGVIVELMCVVLLGTTTPTFSLQVYNITLASWGSTLNGSTFRPDISADGAQVSAPLGLGDIGLSANNIGGFRMLVTSNDTVTQYLVNPMLSITFVDSK